MKRSLTRKNIPALRSPVLHAAGCRPIAGGGNASVHMSKGLYEGCKL
jgi:hypothetical protein